MHGRERCEAEYLFHCCCVGYHDAFHCAARTYCYYRSLELLACFALQILPRNNLPLTCMLRMSSKNNKL